MDPGTKCPPPWANRVKALYDIVLIYRTAHTDFDMRGTCPLPNGRARGQTEDIDA